VEHFTTKCKVISKGVTVVKNRNVSITINTDPKTQSEQWDGMLYLEGNETIIFLGSKGRTFEIELKDGRKGKFLTQNPGHTVMIKGAGPLE
jgi:ribosomal protein L21E